MLWKCCTQYASKFGKLNSGHRPGNGQYHSNSQRKAMPKNVQVTTQLHTSYRPTKECSKFSKLGYISTWTMNFQMFKLDLEKAENQLSNCQHLLIIEKARECQKNIYFCFIDHDKSFDCVYHNKLENSSRHGVPDHLTCLLRNLYAGQEATVRTEHGTTDWF